MSDDVEYAVVVAMVVGLAMSIAGCTTAVDKTVDNWGACYESSVTVIDAWEARMLRSVPPLCIVELGTYHVSYVDAEEEICTAAKGYDGSYKAAACTDTYYRTIQIRASYPNWKRIRFSAHEWTHALASCMDGDADGLHSRRELWGPAGVLDIALNNLPDGACLEWK